MDSFIFEVGLSIQILSLDIESTLWIATLEEYDITGDWFLIIYFDNLPCSDISPFFLNELILFDVPYLGNFCVFLFITCVSFVIFKSIF